MPFVLSLMLLVVMLHADFVVCNVGVTIGVVSIVVDVGLYDVIGVRAIVVDVLADVVTGVAAVMCVFGVVIVDYGVGIAIDADIRHMGIVDDNDVGVDGYAIGYCVHIVGV